VAVAGNVRTFFIAAIWLARNAAGKHSVELAADSPSMTHAPEHDRRFDRIKPIVEKLNSHLSCRLRRIRLRGMASSWRGLQSDASNAG